MSAELLLGRYISSLLVGLLRKTMNFFSVACLQLSEGIVYVLVYIARLWTPPYVCILARARVAMIDFP